jgi:Repeat of Unknown Function (DUF347)
VDRSLGIGYLGGFSLLAALPSPRWPSGIGRSERFRSARSIRSRRRHFTGSPSCFRRRSAPRSATGWPIQPGLAAPAARVFASGLAIIVGAYGWTNVSRTVLFWIAFVLTRPLGATLGDFLDKPFDHGGLAASRYTASATLAATMVLLIVLLPQRAEQHSA